jgi:F-type H+-transporting ATPase subunit delta
LEQIILFNQGKEKVTVILAREEKPETIKKIEKKISEIIKKEIVTEIVLDPSIIGGFIAKTESLTINGSIKGNLIRLKKLIEE